MTAATATSTAATATTSEEPVRPPRLATGPVEGHRKRCVDDGSPDKGNPGHQRPTPNDRVASRPAARRRRVLLSAFACSPIWGSEPGVGWRWACELADRHDVTVLTHSYFREDVEEAMARRPVAGLSFVYFQVPGVGGHPHRQLNSHAYYWLWQLTLRRYVKRLLGSRRYDLIHHLTWGSYRFPSFLGGLGVPMVTGPVGGGEGAPSSWYRSWPARERAFYRLRALSIAISRWDPFVVMSLARAACVLVKSPQTRNALPAFARAKSVRISEIGVEVASARLVHRTTGTLRLLYAGRLLGGKGIPYLLHAMQLLRDRGVDAHLSVAGDGRLDGWVREQIASHGLAGHVTMLGKVARESMNELYDASDLFVFPSWHDSSGNVVTEALSRGLPVLCLDVGGPSVVVDEGCALIVRTQGLDEAGLGGAIAARIEALTNVPEALSRLSAGAFARARDITWGKQVGRAYNHIESLLGWTEAASPTKRPVEHGVPVTRVVEPLTAVVDAASRKN